MRGDCNDCAGHCLRPVPLCVQNLDEARGADCHVVDALASVAIVADRLRMRQALIDIGEVTRGRVRLPESHSIGSLEELTDVCRVLACRGERGGGREFWLVKPRVACGVNESHEMCLVLSPSALPQAVRPFRDSAGMHVLSCKCAADRECCSTGTFLLLQASSLSVMVEAFHNHGGEQLKCYVAGADVFVQHKHSFPDVLGPSDNGTACHIGEAARACQQPFLFRFHSLSSMPQAPGPLVPQLAYDEDLVRECAAEIAARTGLALFGFDLIQPSGQQHWLLIDCNAFPSFKGVADAPSALRRYLRAIAARGKGQASAADWGTAAAPVPA